MMALGSQPLQYYGSQFTVTERMAITGSRAHLVGESTHFIFTRQVLVKMSTGKTVQMLFINVTERWLGYARLPYGRNHVAVGIAQKTLECGSNGEKQREKIG